MEWDNGSILFLCMWRNNFLNTIYWRDCTSPVVCFGTFDEDQLTISVWVYFWALGFALFFYMYVLILLPCCFDYYSFVVYFEVSAISASGSDSCSDSSHNVFCFMACLVIFCWKPYMIWLGIRLCLLFAISMMSQASISPSVLGFVLCVFFRYHYRCFK